MGPGRRSSRWSWQEGTASQPSGSFEMAIVLKRHHDQIAVSMLREKIGSWVVWASLRISLVLFFRWDIGLMIGIGVR